MKKIDLMFCKTPLQIEYKIKDSKLLINEISVAGQSIYGLFEYDEALMEDLHDILFYKVVRKGVGFDWVKKIEEKRKNERIAACLKCVMAIGF